MVNAPWKPAKKRMAVYLRRSEGETGNTENQLERILPMVAALEKAGAIYKVNRGIVGRDITRKRRFDRKRDLEAKGDIYNEGEGASGFDADSRIVLNTLLAKVDAGEYDGVLVESMDRVSRDWTDFVSNFPAFLWRDKGRIVYSLGDGEYLSNDPVEEAVINTRMTWGGIAKKGEIKKAESARTGTVVDKGYFKGSFPEFLGTRGKQHGLDYRRAWNLMQAYGENAKGNLASSSAIGREFGKDNKWANSWYQRLKGYNDLGVLGDWLDAYEAINAFTVALGGYPRNQWKSNAGLKRINKATTGFFAYPAGVQIAGTDEFVLFPNPLSIGLEALASTDDPLTLEDWEVIREPVGERMLSLWQTQQGSRKK